MTALGNLSYILHSLMGTAILGFGRLNMILLENSTSYSASSVVLTFSRNAVGFSV